MHGFARFLHPLAFLPVIPHKPLSWYFTTSLMTSVFNPVYTVNRHIRPLCISRSIYPRVVYNRFTTTFVRPKMTDTNQGGDPSKKTYHKKATGNALITVKNHSKDDDLKLYGSAFW